MANLRVSCREEFDAVDSEELGKFDFDQQGEFGSLSLDDETFMDTEGVPGDFADPLPTSANGSYGYNGEAGYPNNFKSSVSLNVCVL